ncbi:hypothetical protein EDC27_0854 [Desulfosoma caldarium]|uniref:Uncharacterized protein n=1 Tax=Desulfosoma caldarium TaxID=610254 RepID=A0A3N1VFM0_9BACT|nr:hypothetical protein EDC27_0854 [Desulfosoma caldarium]
MVKTIGPPSSSTRIRALNSWDLRGKILPYLMEMYLGSFDATHFIMGKGHEVGGAILRNGDVSSREQGFCGTSG